MPYVTPSQPPLYDRADSAGFTLYMQPVYHQAVIDVVKYYKWTRLYYIYNTLEGLSVDTLFLLLFLLFLLFALISVN